MFNILVTEGLGEYEINELRVLGFNIVDKYYKDYELGKALRDMNALVIRSRNKITKEIIDEACEGKCLKLIIRSGVGLDNIDVKYANSKGITVINTPNGSTRSVAELTIGQIITISRFINVSNITMREGIWNKNKYVGTEIYGKTLGVIGMGRIGKAVAERAYALGMKIIYNDILGEMEGCSKYIYSTLDEVLSTSDFLTIHIPYEKEKGYLITKKEIDRMKDGIYFINHARGKLVCEFDLLQGLKNGKIEAAALDVFEDEPNLNMELVSHPRVSPTPHIGASTFEAQGRIFEEIVDIIKAFFGIDDYIDVAL